MSELLAPRTPGAALRQAREKRRLNMTDVVEATRMKIHIVKALENDDYSVMPAPLYGKGFIKLYAEYVGLDPQPLIRHYLSNYARTVYPTLKTELPSPTPLTSDGIPLPSPMARFRESSGSMLTGAGNHLVEGLQDLLHTLKVAWVRMKMNRERISATGRSVMSSARTYSEAPPLPVGKMAALAFAVLVVAILAASAYYMFPRSNSAEGAPYARSAVAPVKPSTYSQSLRLVEAPPAPYAKLK